MTTPIQATASIADTRLTALKTWANREEQAYKLARLPGPKDRIWSTAPLGFLQWKLGLPIARSLIQPGA